MPDIPSGPKGLIMTICTIGAFFWGLNNATTFLGGAVGVPVLCLVAWGVSAWICDLLGIKD